MSNSFATILAYDIKVIFARPLTILLFVLWIAVLFLAVYNGSGNPAELLRKIDEVQAYYDSVRNATLAEIDSVQAGNKKPGTIWENPQIAWVAASNRGAEPINKNPLPMSAIAIGQSDLYSSLFRLNVNPPWFVVLTNTERLTNPVSQLFGNFDLAFVLSWLLPLLIIALNYNLLSSEKEQGTLQILLTQNISLKRFLLTKLLLRYTLVVAVTLASCISALLIFASGRSDAVALISFAFIILLYAAVWCSMLLCINYAGKSSAWNAGMGFATWLLFVIILPVLINIVANSAFKTPSQVELISAIREASTQADQKSAENLDKYFFDHPEFAPKDSIKVMPSYMYPVALGYEASSRVVYPKIRLYQNQLCRQSNLIQNAGFLSPAILIQESLEEISGNSMDAFLKYQVHADSANRKWMDYMFPRVLGDVRITKAEYESFSDHNYEPAIGTSKLIKIISGLLIWFVLIALLTSRIARKFSVV